MQNIRQSAHLLIRGPIAVTGAAGGIGFAVARQALEAGIPVALLDKGAGGLDAAADRLAPIGGEDTALYKEVLDVADEDAVADAFGAIAAALGPVAGLVTSAGIERTGPVHQFSSALFDEVIATNLRGTFLCARAAINQMLDAEIPGAIVCISSTLGRTAAEGVAAYGASKAATSSLARSLAVEYAQFGIRANSLLPGPTDTALMWGEMSPERKEEVRASIAKEVPLGRMATADEPAAAALWLLSEQASYVTGSEIACDGGVLAKSSVSV